MQPDHLFLLLSADPLHDRISTIVALEGSDGRWHLIVRYAGAHRRNPEMHASHAEVRIRDSLLDREAEPDAVYDLSETSSNAVYAALDYLDKSGLLGDLSMQRERGRWDVQTHAATRSERVQWLASMQTGGTK